MLLYARVAWFNFATYLAYPFEMMAAFVRPFITLGYTLLFWGIVAASSNGAINFRQIVAYFLVAVALSNALLLNNLRFGSLIARAIKNGDISYPLIRPVHVPFFYAASRIGGLGMTYVVSAIFLLTGLILQPPASLWSLLMFVAFLVPAVVISYSLNLLIGVLAFYFTEAENMRFVFNHIMNVFAGTMVPLTLFPSTLKVLALALPFAGTVFGPTQALRTAIPTGEMVLELAITCAWAVVLFIAISKAWRYSLRQYEAVGI